MKTQPLILILLVSMVILSYIGCGESIMEKDNQTLYIGTYTSLGADGIYTMQFNPNTGSLDSLELLVKTKEPSFLAFSQDGKFLYAVQEIDNYETNKGGVSTFSMNGKKATPFEEESSGGAHPCHLALSKSNELVVANYTGGNIKVFNTFGKGQLADSYVIDHLAPDTIIKPHPHKVVFQEGKMFVSDLGLDEIKIYEEQDGKWKENQGLTIKLPKGAGPRHFQFGGLNKLYVLNELNSTITVFEKNDSGEYVKIQTIETLDPNYKGKNACADIHISNDGKFLYASNRGENTIAVFSKNDIDGKLKFEQRISVEGDWPRNFTLSPDEKHLLVANQKSGNIIVYNRDPDLGTLSFLRDYKVPGPVCLLFK